MNVCCYVGFGVIVDVWVCYDVDGVEVEVVNIGCGIV